MLNLKHKLLLTIVFTCISLLSFAQRRLRYLPDDLPTSKIIFLKLSKYQDSSARKGYHRMYRNRNRLITVSNRQLEEEAKNYPFDYVIATREEVPYYKAKGYKYVLDCPFFYSIDTGENLYAGYRKRYTAEIYILNLETGDRHALYSISQTFMFSYGPIMKKVNRMIRKNYKKEIKGRD